MTRRDKLTTMKGADLIRVADNLGVKVACNKARTALKESKQAVIDRIILAEEIRAEAEKVATAEPTLTVPMPVESSEHGPQLIEKAVDVVKKEKKAKKTKAPKRTFENLLAEIPCSGDLQFMPNSKRNAVHVKRGNKRIFGYNGSVLVVNRLEFLKGVQYKTRNYGYVVQPTKENMMAILHNA